MPISDQAILDATLAIASVPGLAMDPDDLLEDAFLLSAAFPDEGEFMAATAATVRALERLIARKVASSSLKYALEGWSSYHYQHRVSQGAPADCRIVFRETGEGVEVKIFGHRRHPMDISGDSRTPVPVRSGRARSRCISDSNRARSQSRL